MSSDQLSFVSLRCSAEDKNKLTDWLFTCRNLNFEIKSRGSHTRYGAGASCLYAMIPQIPIWLCLRIHDLNSSTTIASFSVQGISLYLLWREKVTTHFFKKKREKKRQVTILVQEKMMIDLFG